MIDVMVGVKKDRHTFESTNEIGLTSTSSISDSNYDANTPGSHNSHGSSNQTKRSSQAGWTDDEDNLLTNVVKKYNGRNWKKIAEQMPGRTDVQCLHRWQKVLNPEIVKGPWTKEEDDHIVKMVEVHGCMKWSVIAKDLPGRIGKQCRERWHNHLDPAIKKDAWTEEEESSLAYYHHIYGNKWAEIARFLPGRTDNAIKNHWNSSKRRLDLNIPPVIPTKPASPELRKTYVPNTCSTNLVLGNPKSDITDDDNFGFSRYTKIRKVEPSDSSLTTSETPKREKSESVKDFKFGNSPDSSFLSLSTFGFNEGGEKKIVCGTPSYGSLCYQPPQLKNLAISLENGQLSCSTPPPDLALSISVSSPESILRNSAMSYKNTPSIIRKRTPRKSVSAISSHDCSKNVETIESNNHGSDSWLHRSQPSLGRRLDYMFDSEWDPTIVRCCTPGSVTPSSKPKLMLTP